MIFSLETSQLGSYHFLSPEWATRKEEAILSLSLTSLTISITISNSHLHQIHLGSGKNAYSQALAQAWRVRISGGRAQEPAVLFHVLNFLLRLSLNFQSLSWYAYLNVSKHSCNTPNTKPSTGHLRFCHHAVIPGVIFVVTPPCCVPSVT